MAAGSADARSSTLSVESRKGYSLFQKSCYTPPMRSRREPFMSKQSLVCGKSGAARDPCLANALRNPLKSFVSAKDFLGNPWKFPSIFASRRVNRPEVSSDSPQKPPFSSIFRSRNAAKRRRLECYASRSGTGCGRKKAGGPAYPNPHSSSSNSSRSGDPASTSRLPWWFGGDTTPSFCIRSTSDAALLYPTDSRRWM